MGELVAVEEGVGVPVLVAVFVEVVVGVIVAVLVGGGVGVEVQGVWEEFIHGVLAGTGVGVAAGEVGLLPQAKGKNHKTDIGNKINPSG